MLSNTKAMGKTWNNPMLEDKTQFQRAPFWETFTLCCMSVVSALVMAYVLVFRYNVILADAISRVMNAYYVFFRGYLHFGAIGFVWNPFPSLLELPICAFHGLWPSLVTLGFAGNIASSLFSAVSVYYVNKILFHFGMKSTERVIFCVLFMFNPMIWYYSANGMTDGMLMGCVLGATDGVLMYLMQNRLESLAMGAIWLGIAFMFRYEAAPFFAVTGCALAISLRRLRRPVNEIEAMFVLYAMPTVYAVMAWMFLNWLIMKNPMYFLNSPYGNAAQIDTGSYASAALNAANHHLFQALWYAGRFTLLFWPVLIGIVEALRQQFKHKPDPRWIALLAATISIPLFQAGMVYLDKSAGWSRFFIYYIPFGFLLLGFLITGRHYRSRNKKRIVTIGTTFLVILGDITTFQVMRSPILGSGDSDVITTIASSGHYTSFHQEDIISTYINVHPKLIVLADTFETYEVVARLKRPSQCIITSDVDFNSVVQNPRGRVNTLLVPEPLGISALDALNRAYPDLWAGRVPWTKLVMEFPGDSHFRLYAVTKQAP